MDNLLARMPFEKVRKVLVVSGSCTFTSCFSGPESMEPMLRVWLEARATFSIDYSASDVC
jgi:hypothetical protein